MTRSTHLVSSHSALRSTDLPTLPCFEHDFPYRHHLSGVPLSVNGRTAAAPDGGALQLLMAACRPSKEAVADHPRKHACAGAARGHDEKVSRGDAGKPLIKDEYEKTPITIKKVAKAGCGEVGPCCSSSPEREGLIGKGSKSRSAVAEDKGRLSVGVVQ